MHRRYRSAGTALATAGALAALGSAPLGCRRTDNATPDPAARNAAEPVRNKSGSGLTFPAVAFAQDAPKGAASLADVAAHALPSVVSVASTRVAESDTPALQFDDDLLRRFFGDRVPLPFPSPGGPPAGEQRGLGSGVVVGKGLVLTNAHVVEDSRRLRVMAENKREFDAELVGADPKSDLALIRLKGDSSALQPITFAESSRLRLGDVVLAIGNPFALGQTVTLGIVSAKGRANVGIVDYEDFIQTDAAINPGNSGGALVNMEGKLIGIPTAILSRTGGSLGIGFAIPSDMARPIMNSLLEHGRVVRGWLGVVIQEIDQDLASAMNLPNTAGVLVSDTAQDSPAAKAGLRRGDVILSVNGTPVQSTGDLRNRIAASGVNQKVTLEIRRGGKTERRDVILGEMPNEAPATPGAPGQSARPSSVAGVTVAPLTPELRKQLRLPAAQATGLVVSAVEPGSAAARAGLRPGDVLLELDNKPLRTAADFTAAWEKAQGKTSLLVWRDGRSLFAVIER